MKLYNPSFPILFLTIIFILSVKSNDFQKGNLNGENNTTDTVFVYQKTCNPDAVGTDTIIANDTTFYYITGLGGPISNDSLIAYYPLDKDLEENGYARDMSGYRNDGQIFGTKPVHNKEGLANKAYFFGGDNDSVVVNHSSLYESQDFTVSFWFKKNTDTLQANPEMMLFKGKHPTERTFSFELKSVESPFKLEMHSSNNEGNGVQGADPPIEQDSIIYPYQWYHVVGTINTINDTLIIRKLFLNGDSIQVDSLIGHNNGTIYLENYDLTIGGWQGNDGGYPNNGLKDFIGEMDEVRIYNRILSNDEIMTLYNSPNCPCAPVYEYLTTCDPEKVGIDTTVVNDTTYIRVTGLEGPISNEGLIGYYPFDKAYDEIDYNGIDLAKDMSGFKNHGRAKQLNLTYNKDLIQEKAYRFYGNEDPIVALPTEEYLSQNYTVSFWFRPLNNTLQSAFTAALVYMGRSSPRRTFWFELKDLSPGDEPWSLQLINSTVDIPNPEGITTNDTIYSARWYHALGTVQTLNNNLIRRELYLNGNKILSDDLLGQLYLHNTDISTVEDSLVIGGTNNPGNPDGRDFDGVIDEIRIYNRILSNNEIKTLFNSPVCQCATEYEFLTTCNPNEVGMQKDTIDGKEHIIVTALNSLISTDSLVAYFPMGIDYQDGNLIGDYSGFGNHGLTEIPTTRKDRRNDPAGALWFDGHNDSVYISHNSIYNSRKLSVSFWFKKNLVPVFPDTIRDKLVQKGTFNRPFSFEIKHYGQSDSWDLQMNTTSEINNIILENDNMTLFGVVNPDENWHHVVGTIHQYRFDSIERKLYFDNELMKTDVVFGQLILNLRPILLGGEENSGDGDYYGDLDDFRLYSRILNENEVEALYNFTHPDCNVIYQYETTCDESGIGNSRFSSNDSLFINLTAEVNPINNEGLVGYYPITEMDSTLMLIYDHSGNGNHAHPFGSAVYIEDKCGIAQEAFDCLGEDENIRIDHNSAFNSSEFSFSLWFYKTNASINSSSDLNQDDVEGIIIKGFNGTPPSSSFYLLLKDRPEFMDLVESEPPFVLSFNVSNGLDLTVIETDAIIEPQKWYHLSGVVKENKISLFVKENENEWMYENDFSGGMNLVNGSFLIGAYTSSPYNYLAGRIDEIRLYRRILSDSEIQRLYENHCAPPQIDTSICDGEIYTINNEAYTQSGFYELNLPNYYGCDSLVNLNLTVHETPIFQLDTTICANDSISVCDTIFAVPYSNEVVMQTIICNYAAWTECDSLVELAITTLPLADSFTDSLICFTESVEICNETIPVHPGLNEIIQICPEAGWNGCDSIVEMMLEVQTSRDTMIDFTLCPGDSLEVCDTVFVLEIGIHQFEYWCTSVIEPYCDSLIEMTVEVLPFTTITDTFSICMPDSQSVQVSDTTYTCDGIPYDGYFSSIIRCDTIYNTTIHCNFCGLEIPNAFSPNGDGINDTFVIPELNDHPSEFGNNELWILNRREEVVFKSDIPYKNDWGGCDLQGNPLLVGTYLYRFRYTNSGGKEVVISDVVTIIR